jgi:Tfp pilus assembly protein PilO
MPSKIQTIKIILRNVAEACAAIAVCGILVSVSSSQISNIVGSITQARETSMEGQDRSAAISQLQSQFATIDGNDAKISNALMHENDIIPFVDALNSLASKDSVQQSYNFSSPAPYASQGNLNVYSIPYSIGLTGNVNAFMKYLSDFQSLPYFTNISSVSISAPSGLGQNSTMNMAATLYIQQ